MLQPWKHEAFGKAKIWNRNSSSSSSSRVEHLNQQQQQQQHRQLKGLGEIEEMEGSMKSMQALERFMRKHPDVWSDSCVHHLLLETTNTRYTRSDERLHTMIMRMLVPMAKIMDVEQESVKLERQKIQEATLALQRVQEECQHALADLTNEHARSARDLEELGKALEENRMAAEEAGRKLTQKENQIQRLLQQQQDLLVRLVCGGPAQFLNWATEQIQLQGLVNLHKELEHTWRPIINKTEAPQCKQPEEEEGKSCQQFVYKEPEEEGGKSCKQFVYKEPEEEGESCKQFVHKEQEEEGGKSCKQFVYREPEEEGKSCEQFVYREQEEGGGGKSCKQFVYREGGKSCEQFVYREQEEGGGGGKLCKQFVCKKASVSTVTMTLVSVMVSETMQQMVESCGRVTGPFSLPSAVAGFWLGLAGRMSCLAMVTLFPQLVIMHKSSSSCSGPG